MPLDFLMPIAQIAAGGGSIVQWVIWAILIVAVFVIAGIAMRKFGVSVPDWVVQMAWVVVVAFVAISAILFLCRIAGFV